MHAMLYGNIFRGRVGVCSHSTPHGQLFSKWVCNLHAQLLPPQPSCSLAPQQEQGLAYCISASSFSTRDQKALTSSAMLYLHRAGEKRGILSIIYTIVTPWQNYQTSLSRGSLPYIRKTSVIMYFDLLLFFFSFPVHKELIKTHLTSDTKPK